MRIFFGEAEGGAVVSLSDKGRVLQVARASTAEDPLELADKVLTDAGAERSAVTEIAVDRGPGGFSTVRRRVAVATGLARSLGARLGVFDTPCSPEQAADAPAEAFKSGVAISPLYAGAPNITASKKKKTWTAR